MQLTILGLSILLQFTAAVIALSLIRKTGRYSAWVLLAAAIVLMAVRRTITFTKIMAAGQIGKWDPTAESVALVISVLMVVGVATIGPVFDALRKLQSELEDELREKTEAEKRLKDANRILRIRNNCTDVIRNAGEKEGLIDRICNTLRTTAGYSVIWFGIPGDIGQGIKPMYCASSADADAGNLGDSYLIQKTALLAMSGARTFVCRNISACPELADCTGEAEIRGIRSLVSIPLLDNKIPFATLNILDSHADGFDTSEVRVLRDLSVELAQFLVSTEIRKDRDNAITLLQESERRFTRFFMNLGDAVFVTSLSEGEQGAILEANPAAELQTGYTREELLKMNILKDIVAVDEKNDGKLLVEDLLSGNRVTFTERKRNKNGAEYWTEVVVTRIDYLGQSAALSINRDITERKNREEELQKIDKLESIGTLAGGIAHDFNNILTAIYGNISLAKMNMKEEDQEFGLLTEAERSVNRATVLSGQLLTFAKGGAPYKEMTDLDSLVRETVFFSLSGSSVKPHFKIREDAWKAQVDRAQIRQVIGNLVQNAVEAMGRGGDLYISMNRVAKENLELPGPPPGNYAEIIVRDGGCGIPEKNLDKIFDPYFSTKKNGNGLGLTTAYSILKRHGGWISVDSRVNEGTAVTVLLPCRREYMEGMILESSMPTLSVAGARILVMDDDEMIRNLAKYILKEEGHIVTTAEDGEEALNLFRQNLEIGMPFDAVILDLTIPGGMGGRETVAELRKIDPKVKAIVSSGYADDDVIAEYKRYGFAAAAAKPYSNRGLIRVVRDVLGQDQSG